MSTDEFGVFARVVPEEKYRLVRALQGRGHVVGMCGDGTNDAAALRQAQIGIAVSTATDVAKAAAGVVMTEPGLAGIVFAVARFYERVITGVDHTTVVQLKLAGECHLTSPFRACSGHEH
jgi:H+-transporting ATPase